VMRKIDELIIHCTATRAEWMSDNSTVAKVKEVTKWHLDRGWSDCGYHYLIDRDGTVSEARPVDKAGAHAKGHNAHSIGISIFGGHGGDQDDKFDVHFTAEQDRALRRLIAQLRMEYPAIKTVRGHNEVSAKMCPCFQVTPWLNSAEAEKKPERKRIAQTKTIQASSVAKMASVATPLVGVVGGLPWQNLAIMGVLAVVAMVALGVIDLERLKKWDKGDR